MPKKKSKKTRGGVQHRRQKKIAVTIVATNVPTDDVATKTTQRQPARKSFKKKNSNDAAAARTARGDASFGSMTTAAARLTDIYGGRRSASKVPTNRRRYTYKPVSYVYQHKNLRSKEHLKATARMLLDDDRNILNVGSAEAAAAAAAPKPPSKPVRYGRLRIGGFDGSASSSRLRGAKITPVNPVFGSHIHSQLQRPRSGDREALKSKRLGSSHTDVRSRYLSERTKSHENLSTSTGIGGRGARAFQTAVTRTLFVDGSSMDARSVKTHSPPQADKGAMSPTYKAVITPPYKAVTSPAYKKPSSSPTHKKPSTSPPYKFSGSPSHSPISFLLDKESTTSDSMSPPRNFVDINSDPPEVTDMLSSKPPQSPKIRKSSSCPPSTDPENTPATTTMTMATSKFLLKVLSQPQRMSFEDMIAADPVLNSDGEKTLDDESSAEYNPEKPDEVPHSVRFVDVKKFLSGKFLQMDTRDFGEHVVAPTALTSSEVPVTGGERPPTIDTAIDTAVDTAIDTAPVKIATSPIAKKSIQAAAATTLLVAPTPIAATAAIAEDVQEPSDNEAAAEDGERANDCEKDEGYDCEKDEGFDDVDAAAKPDPVVRAVTAPIGRKPHKKKKANKSKTKRSGKKKSPKGGSPSARPSRAVVIDAINEIKDASLAVLNQTNQSLSVLVRASKPMIHLEDDPADLFQRQTLLEQIILTALKCVRSLGLTSLLSSRMEARLRAFRLCTKIILQSVTEQPGLLHHSFKHCALQGSPSRFFIILLRVCPPGDDLVFYVASILLKLGKVEKKVDRVQRSEKAVSRILQILHGVTIDKNIKGKIALLELLAAYCLRNETGRAACSKIKGFWRLLLLKSSATSGGSYLGAAAKVLQLLIRKSSKFAHRVTNCSSRLQTDRLGNVFYSASKNKHSRGLPETLISMIKQHRDHFPTLRALLSLSVTLASYPMNARVMVEIKFCEGVLDGVFRKKTRAKKDADPPTPTTSVWENLPCIRRILELMSLLQRQKPSVRMPPLFAHNEWTIPAGHPDDVECSKEKFLERCFPESFPSTRSTTLKDGDTVPRVGDMGSNGDDNLNMCTYPPRESVGLSDKSPIYAVAPGDVPTVSVSPVQKYYAHRGVGQLSSISIGSVRVHSLRALKPVLPETFPGTPLMRPADPMVSTPPEVLTRQELKIKQDQLRRIIKCSTPRCVSMPPCRVVFAFGKQCTMENYHYPSPSTARPFWMKSKSAAPLRFSCSFESGNLCTAIQTGPRSYELSVWRDFNTTSHSQWFYFSVQGMDNTAPYTFNVVNLHKKSSLFQRGMRPLSFSCTATQNSRGSRRWERCGESVLYYTNHYQGPPMSSFRSNLRKGSSNKMSKAPNWSFLATLSFHFTPEYNNDRVFFAYSYPYTYTMMSNDMTTIATQNPLTTKLSTLCYSVLRNPLPLLTISDFSSNVQKQYAVISGRVHPGESPASWMMNGFLRFVVSDDPVAEELRRRFVFKVIPMLNPDGVINGNLRCNMNGLDMNRCWSHPVPNITPPVYCAKRLLELCESHSTPHRRVRIFCDFHAHSRTENIFVYGCDNVVGTPERVFPLLLSRHCPQFVFEDCGFNHTAKSKQSCARIAVWRDLGILMSYTLESTFSGGLMGKPDNPVHFDCSHFEGMGRSFAETLLHVADGVEGDAEGLSEPVRRALVDLQEMFPEKYRVVKSGKKGSGRKKRASISNPEDEGGCPGSDEPDSLSEAESAAESAAES